MSVSLSRPRLLAITASSRTVSLARVGDSILSAVAEDMDIHQLAIGYDGDPHTVPWAMYPAARPGDNYGYSRLIPLIKQLKPDLIFYMLGPIMLLGFLQRLAQDDSVTSPPSLAYVPVDGYPVNRELVTLLPQLTRLVLCTEFSEKIVRDSARLWSRSDEPLTLPPIEVIPHALDSSVFYPLRNTDGTGVTDRRALRQKHWPRQPGLEDAFIVLNANRNQPRKRIDITVKGFAEFARNKTDAYLCLHMGLKDKGWDLPGLVRFYGIEDLVILATETAGPPAVTDERLNILYNLCDVGINTSYAEGWGLVSFEHAATGAAQLVPGFGNCEALWQGYADLLPVRLSLYDERLNMEQKLIASRDVADALEQLYQDRDYLASQSTRALQRVGDPILSPAHLRQRWRTEFHRMLTLSPAADPHG